MKDRIIKSRRDIPSVEKLASDSVIIDTSTDLARPLIVEIIRLSIDSFKKSIGREFKPISYDSFRQKIISDIDLMKIKRSAGSSTGPVSWFIPISVVHLFRRFFSTK